MNLKGISESRNEDKFKNITSSFPERFSFAITMFNATFEKRDEFIQQMIHHFIFSVCSEEL